MLRAALDESGIRNRVIAVSACFSGGWIEPLATDSTLIMTAAGLAVAIPAVLAYNVFGKLVSACEADLEGFAHDLREALLGTPSRDRDEA